MFLLYQEVRTFTRLGFFFLGGFLRAENLEDDEEDGEENQEEEPEGADDNDFIDVAVYTLIFHIIDDMEDADAGGFFPTNFRKSRVAWHNPTLLWVFFVSEDLFVGKKRKNL